MLNVLKVKGKTETETEMEMEMEIGNGRQNVLAHSMVETRESRYNSKVIVCVMCVHIP